MDFLNIFIFILQFVVVAMCIISTAAFLYSFAAAIIVEILIFTDKLKVRLKRTNKHLEDHHENY